MGHLWTPPSVDKRLRDSTAQHEAAVTQMMDRFRGNITGYTRMLKDIDPYLELVFFPPTAELPEVVPGRYHVIRHNPGTVPLILPWQITDSGRYFLGHGEGHFAEPNSALPEMLRAMDLQNPHVQDDLRRKREAAARAREREKARETEDRQLELIERYKAATETSVSMNTSAPWTQNVAGRRGRRR